MIDPAMYRLLSIYSSLGSAARQAARTTGVQFSLTELPATTVQLLNESVARSDLLKPVEKPTSQWPFTLTLGDPSAKRKAVDLPAGTVIEFRVETARLFSLQSGQTPRGFSIGALMTPVETATGVYNSRSPGAPVGFAEQFRHLAIIDAERLVIVLHFTDGTRLESKIQTDSRSPDTRYVPLETLEGTEVDAYLKELRRLEAGGS